jgi:hypothetical protein
VLFLAIWHDPAIWRAIDGSGGIAEALGGVQLILVPVATIVGTVGALAGRMGAMLFERTKTTSAR